MDVKVFLCASLSVLESTPAQCTACYKADVEEQQDDGSYRLPLQSKLRLRHCPKMKIIVTDNTVLKI